MKTRRWTILVMVLECLGFLLALLVIWADEFLDAPHYLFGTPPAEPRWPEFWFESCTVSVLGLCVMAATLALFRRIRRLESFVVLCAWCNKVRIDKEWVPVTRYLNEHQHKITSHGLCPECMDSMLKQVGEPDESETPRQ